MLCWVKPPSRIGKDSWPGILVGSLTLRLTWY